MIPLHRPLSWLAAASICALAACGGGGSSGGDAGPAAASGPAPAASGPGTAAVSVAPAVAAGAGHTLALKSDGTVWAWGANAQGQLGNDGTSPSPNPVRVAGLNQVVAISARENTSMALRADGTVWTWGFGGDAQLGIGGPLPAPTLQSNTPVQVSALTKVKAISMGFHHALALRDDGTVWGWGANSYGQLGLGHTSSQSAPAMVPGNDHFTAIAAGGSSSVALKAGFDDWIYAWGDNSTGQLGQGNTTSSLNPVQVQPLSYGYFSALAIGRSHVITLAGDYKDLAGWGYNTSGQLGDDSLVTRTRLSTNPNFARPWTAIAAGEYFSLGLDDSGLWSWGDNTEYQLGTGSPAKQPRPTLFLNSLPDERVFTAIAAGSSHGVALSRDGRVWTWGLNDAGQLGRTTPRRTDSWNAVTNFNVLK